jgi:hypothetical protein
VGGLKPYSGMIWELKFEIAPQDFDLIVKTQNYERTKLPEITEEDIAELRKNGNSQEVILQYQLGSFTPRCLPYEPLESPEAYHRKSSDKTKSFDFIGMLTNKSHTKVYFFRRYE